MRSQMLDARASRPESSPTNNGQYKYVGAMGPAANHVWRFGPPTVRRRQEGQGKKGEPRRHWRAGGWRPPRPAGRRRTRRNQTHPAPRSATPRADPGSEGRRAKEGRTGARSPLPAARAVRTAFIVGVCACVRAAVAEAEAEEGGRGGPRAQGEGGGVPYVARAVAGRWAGSSGRGEGGRRGDGERGVGRTRRRQRSGGANLVDLSSLARVRARLWGQNAGKRGDISLYAQGRAARMTPPRARARPGAIARAGAVSGFAGTRVWCSVLPSS